MKVLFTTYRNAFKFPGGGEIIFKKCGEYLAKKGIDIEIYDFKNEDFSKYDIVHNFSVVGECLDIVNSAKNQGKKVALHTIYWPQDEYALKGHIGFATKMKKWLYTFLNKYSKSKMRKIMDASDILFPNSVAEGEQLMRDFRCPRGKIHVVHDGVDKRFFEGAEKEFFGEYGLKDFVLYVGRIEPRKNVLNLIKAIKGTNLELVVVGDYDRETPRYYEKCKAAANESVHFLGRIEHESKLLVSAYYAAKVLALPSWYETPGIVALEAGAAGCNIVITDRGCTKEYFSDFAEYVAPDDLNGIRTAILRACKKSRNNALRERIRKNYSWENVADEIIAGYLKITGN